MFFLPSLTLLSTNLNITDIGGNHHNNRITPDYHIFMPHMEADLSDNLPVAEGSLAVAGHYKDSKWNLKTQHAVLSCTQQTQAAGT